MRERNAIFGGEHSGHFYFRDFWYADSGMIAMLVVLELVSQEGKSVSTLIRSLDTRMRSGESAAASWLVSLRTCTGGIIN